MSGWEDSNLRHLGSKPSTLAKLSYTLLCALAGFKVPAPHTGHARAEKVDQEGFEPSPNTLQACRSPVKLSAHIEDLYREAASCLYLTMRFQALQLPSQSA